MATVLIVSGEHSSQLAVPMAEDGHRVVEADHSGEILRQVIRLNPDVIIMPDDTETVVGLDLLHIVRPMTEAIMITVGSGGSDNMAKALFEGADAYFEHPVDRASVRSRVHALLRRQTPKRRHNGGTR